MDTRPAAGRRRGGGGAARGVLPAVLLLACAAAPARASLEPGAEELFAAANQAYSARDYATARDLYSRHLSEYGPNAVVEFNLGNAWFRLGNLGRAILHYERSLRLNPRNGAVRRNLAIAREEIEDAPVESRSIALVDFFRGAAELLNRREWTLAASGGYLVAILALVVRVLWAHRAVRAASRNLAVAFGLLALWAAGNAMWWAHREGRGRAVVVEPTLAVYAEPSADAEESFRLHTGSTVEILRRLNPDAGFAAPGRREADGNPSGWCEIRRGPILKGFCRASGVERI